jgi:hypothetical protein
VLLVPIDLASSSRDGGGPKAIWLPERLLLVSWRITYWLIFVLTWYASYFDSVMTVETVFNFLGFAGPFSRYSANISIPDTAMPEPVSNIPFAPMPDTR